MKLAKSIACICGVVAAYSIMLAGSAFGAPLQWDVMDARSGGEIMLPIQLSHPERVYLSSLFAVKIHSVECDGVLVPPTYDGVALYSLDQRVSGYESLNVGYVISARSIGTVVDYKYDSGDYRAQIYTLPKGVKKAKITYSVRLPDHSETGPYIVKVVFEKGGD